MNWVEVFCVRGTNFYRQIQECDRTEKWVDRKRIGQEIIDFVVIMLGDVKIHVHDERIGKCVRYTNPKCHRCILVLFSKIRNRLNY